MDGRARDASVPASLVDVLCRNVGALLAADHAAGAVERSQDLAGEGLAAT